MPYQHQHLYCLLSPQTPRVRVTEELGGLMHFRLRSVWANESPESRQAAIQKPES